MVIKSNLYFEWVLCKCVGHGDEMGSFTLKNGMRIHTYGEYDKDGWKVPNPSALPWEKNNFKGAFELKSANGAFGIRIEVQQGRHVPY